LRYNLIFSDESRSGWIPIPKWKSSRVARDEWCFNKFKWNF